MTVPASSRWLQAQLLALDSHLEAVGRLHQAARACSCPVYCHKAHKALHLSRFQAAHASPCEDCQTTPLSPISAASQDSVLQLQLWLSSQGVAPTSKGGLGDSQTSASRFVSLIRS